ncbi:unnamed protein product, partial [Sphagnum tenellum]
MELGFQLKSAELCMTVFEIQLTPHPFWNYVKLEGVHNRNGESGQNRKLLWSPDVSLEAFSSFRTLHVECNSARTWKWGWDIQGRGTIAILAMVNVECANVLNINCKMGLLQLQRKIIH